MRFYLVTAAIFRREQDGMIEHFTCQADDAEHAIEQMRSAYVPHRLVIISVSITH